LHSPLTKAVAVNSVLRHRAPVIACLEFRQLNEQILSLAAEAGYLDWWWSADR